MGRRWSEGRICKSKPAGNLAPACDSNFGPCSVPAWTGPPRKHKLSTATCCLLLQVSSTGEYLSRAPDPSSWEIYRNTIFDAIRARRATRTFARCAASDKEPDIDCACTCTCTTAPAPAPGAVGQAHCDGAWADEAAIGPWTLVPETAPPQACRSLGTPSCDLLGDWSSQGQACRHYAPQLSSKIVIVPPPGWPDFDRNRGKFRRIADRSARSRASVGRMDNFRADIRQIPAKLIDFGV